MDVYSYITELQNQLDTGVATEHAYRPALKFLFESSGLVTAINDPSRSEYGNPDFIFKDKQNLDLIRGYGESKDIYVNLDNIEKSEQMRRYLGYANLILTNGLDFRFYRNGEKYYEVSLGFLENNKIVLNEENINLFADELSNFLEKEPEKIRSAKRLAEIMGGKARRIRENINLFFAKENDVRNLEIKKIYQVVRELLVHDLNLENFSDMYAQTLVYGLFVARYNDKSLDTFTRQEARDLVPASNPFLRQFFDHIAGNSFDKRLAYIVDELCAVFQVSDIKTIIKQHFKQENLFENEVATQDPIIHFYEDFLKEYDPVLKKKMGAYYTPVPVVRFIVRAVDEILKSKFNLPQGLADTSTVTRVTKKNGSKTRETLHQVQILDPAVGTATFLNELVKYIFENNFQEQEGRWTRYVDDDLIPRLYGFELMMAPYTIAHLKLSMTLKELGYNKDFDKRLGIYLTNTLEEGVKRQLDLLTFGLQEAISKESQAAAEIKHNKPIMVVIGNPPYSGESSNKTEYAMNLVKKYKFEPGGKLKLQEKNPKWINDDYVKFIAFAEDMISKNGEGIMAMITNHAYLDNPTFRGMRWHLAKTFDDIYILDLHGNAKKHEKTPNGGKDENVFDIMQGVSIILATKTRKNSKKLADVYCADLFGKRKYKYEKLNTGIDKWEKITLDKKMFYFTNTNTHGKHEYEKGFLINELFTINSVGVVTAADSIFIANSKNELKQQILDAKNNPQYGKIHIKLSEHDFLDNNIKNIAYRPFDNRYIYYDTDLIERSRKQVMQHMYVLKDNLGLTFIRNNQGAQNFSHVLLTNKIFDAHYHPGLGYLAPLYLSTHNYLKTTNFNSYILEKITHHFKNTYLPEDILDYIYAVLYSPKYREKYQEFLKIDFPRVPYPKNEKIFWQLVEKGKKLRELHLMNDPSLEKLMTTYPQSGDDNVEKVEYKDEKVFINKEQYFGNVPEVAWNFFIGGYQPAQKWLKDRTGRILSNEDLGHYQKIIKVLVETDKVMKEIDEIKFI